MLILQILESKCYKGQVKAHSFCNLHLDRKTNSTCLNLTPSIRKDNDKTKFSGLCNLLSVGGWLGCHLAVYQQAPPNLEDQESDSPLTSPHPPFCHG